MIKKILLIVFILLYQNSLHSKTNENINFNQRYLSNYFSAMLSFNNKENDRTIKFFDFNKRLISKSDDSVKKYILSLLSEGKTEKAINYILRNEKDTKLNFFEANLLLYSDSILKKDFLRAEKYVSRINEFKDIGTFENIIAQTIQSFNYLFLNGSMQQTKNNLGKLTLINRALQECYIGSGRDKNYFLNLINSEDGDYSRYIYFYINSLINNKDFTTAKSLSNTINELDSNLLILQSKKWIENEEYENFTDYFSCKNETDIISEFLFIIANLYSSQEEYEKSNYYLNISNFLNNKFIFNYSLLAENYLLNEEYEKAEKILKIFNRKFEIYFWFKIKKIGQIISKKKDNEESLKYIEENYKKIINPNYKIVYDFANIQKNFGNYKKSIEFYDLTLKSLKNHTVALSEIYYRRGSSFERIGDYQNSDKDLLKSLELEPNDPYVLNYLAYSWLERNFKINIAIDMLEEAYGLTENNPYITDSLGWGYFLNKEYFKAEKYLNMALQIKPDDAVIMDHYGDALWMLGRKLQANYYWKKVLRSDETEDINKSEVKNKILNGLRNT